MNWRGGLTLVLLIAAILSSWSAWQQRHGTVPTTAATQRSDYLLRNFELIALDQQGKEAFTLRAPQLARNPGDKTMALETPLFLLPDNQGQYWQVRSNTGWVSADNEEVRLRGNVVAISPSQTARKTRMRTQQLNVFPDTERATSPDLVTITQGGSTMSGRGMQVDLARKRYLLQSQVKHHYVPRQ